MKKMVKTFLLLTFAGLTLSACSFDMFIKPQIQSLEIEDTTSIYFIGETYLEKANLSILATYKNETQKELQPSEVSFLLTLNNKNYLVSSPFTEAGTYTLTATYQKVHSNTLTITVLTEAVYAESLSLSGETSMSVYQNIDIDVVVNPNDYTGTIIASVNDDSLADVGYENGAIRVYAKKAGILVVTAKALKNSTSYVEATHTITIDGTLTSRKASQTYTDYMHNCIYSKSACPSVGSPKLLIIPVWFTDSSEFIALTKRNKVREDIQKVYFGTKQETGWHSVSSYYQEESGGLLTLTGTVSEWYGCGKSYKDLASDGDGITNRLVDSAVNWYFRNNSSDSRKNYDTDGDGYLDGVMLIYGAPEYRYTEDYYGDGDFSNLWAYCYWLQTNPNVNSPVANVYFWCAYDFMYGADAINTTGTNFYGGDTYHSNFDSHTFIHEMGHVFGLDDYYDYCSIEPRCPSGGFSMQDYNVGGHDPFSCYTLGWAQAIIPTESMTITLKSFQESHEFILLTPEWNQYNSPFDEYFILELYSNTGLNKFDSMFAYRSSYPQGPSLPGIRLWHIDGRLVTYKYNYEINDWELDGYYNDVRSHQYGVLTYFTNTHYEDGYYYPFLDETNGDYSLLQLIRNDKSMTYETADTIVQNDLFMTGSSFNMSDYHRQFVKGNKMNSGKTLGWSFNVLGILANLSGGYLATIQLIKG